MAEKAPKSPPLKKRDYPTQSDAPESEKKAETAATAVAGAPGEERGLLGSAVAGKREHKKALEEADKS